MATSSFQTRFVKLMTILLYSLLVGANVITVQQLPNALQKRELNPPLPDINEVKAQMLKPQRDECVFWSWNSQFVAMEWSWDNGKKMMGDFDALPNGKTGYVGFEGGAFDEYLLRDDCGEPTWTKEEHDRAIGICCQAYAELCSGVATVVLDKNYRWGSPSAWENFELPALKANRDITDILVQWIENGKPVGGPVRLDR